MKVVHAGGRARRPCWHPGSYVEIGAFQGRLAVFAVIPKDDPLCVGGLYVTWTPIVIRRLNLRTGEMEAYPEDEWGEDWEVVK